MNKHDYLVDNVNSKSPVDSDHEVRSTQMCSYQQDESTENCSFQQCGACGDVCVAMSHQFLEILDFTYFYKHAVFIKNEENILEKCIYSSIYFLS